MTQGKFLVLGWATLGHTKQLQGIVIEDFWGKSTDFTEADGLGTKIENNPGTLAARIAEVDIVVFYGVQTTKETLRVHNISLLIESSLDIVDLAKVVMPTALGFRLEFLCHQLGLSLEQVSVADGCNPQIIWAIFRKLLSLLEMMPWNLLEEICSLAQEQATGLSKILQINLQKKIKQGWTKPNVGDASFQKEVEDIPQEQYHAAIAEPTLEQLEAVFAENSLLSKSYSDYELRREQLRMVEEVHLALAQQQNLVVEAGTGTGKSLGYLVPAVLWAVHTRHKAVVATNTIHLQEQLWRNDLPRLKQVLGLNFEACLLKGRSNYLCLRRWLREREFLPGDAPVVVFKMRLTAWLSQTLSADVNELCLDSEEAAWWHRVSSETETCLGNSCRWYSSCFYQQTRRRARKADLILVNHSLLLSDSATGNQILPEYSFLVIDEAHNLEGCAMEQLGLSLGELDFKRLVRYLFAEKKYYPPGLITRCRNLIEAKEFQSLQLAASDLRKHLREFWLLAEQGWASQRRDLRITNQLLTGNWWQSLEIAADNLGCDLGYLKKLLSRASDQLESDYHEDAKELNNQIEVIDDLLAKLEVIFGELMENHVYVLTKSTINGDLSFRVSPIEPGNMLADLLYADKRSVILTSATMTIAGSFEYVLQGSGLNRIDHKKLQKLKVDSPFNYREQTLLAICTDVPDPSSSALFRERVPEILSELLSIQRSRTLVLFTSHELLRHCYRIISDGCLVPPQRMILGQGIDGSKQQMVETFKANSQAVIFGANTFWEGIDLPGELLECVIITKLPFLAPGSPVVAAKSELITKKGINAFQNYSIPEAALKFKQGFGRLIRTYKDKGVIVVLDSRLAFKGYGKIFLNSLPLTERKVGTTHQIYSLIGDWLEK